MSGHSKWANIKHRKASVDARRGPVFTKVSRLITVAARKGGADPAMNASLRLALEKARAANMPKDTIERAIKKGTGDLEGMQFEELFYEGYGSGGVAVYVEALTNNRNRTTPEVRRLFEKAGGSLGAVGCVAWMFKRRGRIIFKAGREREDEFMETALELGADDVQADDGEIEVLTQPEVFEKVLKGFREKKLEPASAELTFTSDPGVPADAATAQKIIRLIENLEEHDDVQNVHTNMDISPTVQAELEKQS